MLSKTAPSPRYRIFSRFRGGRRRATRAPEGMYVRAALCPAKDTMAHLLRLNLWEKTSVIVGVDDPLRASETPRRRATGAFFLAGLPRDRHHHPRHAGRWCQGRSGPSFLMTGNDLENSHESVPSLDADTDFFCRLFFADRHERGNRQRASVQRERPRDSQAGCGGRRPAHGRPSDVRRTCRCSKEGTISKDEFAVFLVPSFI